MKSKEIMGFLAMAKAYRQKPSDLLGVDDPYTAFCFDEACFYLEARLASGQKPVYKSKAQSFSEFYNGLVK